MDKEVRRGKQKENPVEKPQRPKDEVHFVATSSGLRPSIRISRRYFLEIVGGGAIGVAAVGSVVLTAQFLSPNVLLEPSLKFKAGPTQNFPPDSVTLNKDQKVFIIRASEGYFYALSSVCPHLGCLANWKPEERIITCPCHGSKFDGEGKVLEGPAPGPLPRFSMKLDEQGQLVVDKGTIVGDEFILKV